MHSYINIRSPLLRSTILPLSLRRYITPRYTPTAVASLSISIPDSELSARGFSINYSTTNLNPSALNDVFASVGFPRRDTARLNLALSHSSGSLVWLSRTTDPTKPVAFARATGDGVFNAVVWDVVVDPSYQGIGLGKAVMERVIADLREKGIVNIALYAEPRVISFYRPLGFIPDPDGIKGMVYSRRNLQKKKR
ncbi:hypothetical protein LUZ62_043105 [Rhynchospora pubera]|uniref:N-acetyltransferase domain-containing protein n=1 Tax=Rhynchospora pubera TaxID=906938 RepID=A0AAV8FJM4_9POAL|nr:hypothetical protein LUZ62_043105 [Rhynchospora pubera]